MNAQEAETAYRTAKSQLDAAQITLDEFNRRVAELKYQDNAGVWWAVSPADGGWLKWDGAAWVPAFAQAAPAARQAPVQQPPAQPVAAQPVVQPATQAAAAPAQPAAAGAAKPARNWTGIISLILGILSWAFYPYILAIAALAVGAYSLYSTRKTTGRIAFIAVAALIIALASILVDNFWFVLFPPTGGLTLVYWMIR